jgi:hypothetical protein
MGEEREWQPIATAPRDGTKILVWIHQWAGEIHGVANATGNEIAYWANGTSDFPGADWWVCAGGDGYATWCRPTHWMPLPAPPQPIRHEI